MKILHMIFPMVFAIIYTVFGAIHQAATGIVIYSTMDWKKLSTTLPLTLGFIFIGVPLLHGLFFGLTKFRDRFCCGNSRKQYNTVI